MGAYATGSPLFPRGYVAGTVSLTTAGTAYNLLALIQTQLDAQCGGSAYEVNLQTDASGNVYVGSRSNLVGNLSSTNYGYELISGSPGASRTYRSGFPGSHSSVGDLWVVGSASPTTLHVELMG